MNILKSIIYIILFSSFIISLALIVICNINRMKGNKDESILNIIIITLKIETYVLLPVEYVCLVIMMFLI